MSDTAKLSPLDRSPKSMEGNNAAQNASNATKNLPIFSHYYRALDAKNPAAVPLSNTSPKSML